MLDLRPFKRLGRELTKQEVAVGIGAGVDGRSVNVDEMCRDQVSQDGIVQYLVEIQKGSQQITQRRLYLQSDRHGSAKESEG